MRIQLCEFVFCVRVYGYVTVHMGLYVHVFALLGLITTIILIKDSRAERRQNRLPLNPNNIKPITKIVSQERKEVINRKDPNKMGGNNEKKAT